ncbi:hypothetical protein H0H87_006277 [Tephrocybe sp. NHM501043]|nr:hypothetical protein H0H87_006277 [Tephrocybe sp. NHM501043]
MDGAHSEAGAADDARISLKMSSSTAYIYPIKSLLSGLIQPAAEDQVAPSIQASDSAPHLSNRKYPPETVCPPLPSSGSQSSNDWNGSIRSSRSDRDPDREGKQTSLRGSAVHHKSMSVSPGISPSTSPERLRSSRSCRSRRSYSPNFSHYPAGSSPELPRSFSSHSMNAFISPFNPSQPLHRPGAGHDRQSEANNRSRPGSTEGWQASPSKNMPLNPTEFVHLLPLSRPPSAPERNDDNLFATAVPLEPESAPMSREESVEPSISAERSHSSSNSEFFSSRSSVTSETEQHVSFRFEHMEDENGNHVIVGREGMLQKCEDEPICTPGSVQAFGVLIAVQELEDTLVVRQVSENSTEVLGLSPRHLFSLECFTDILPESQANQLWEHIPYLPNTHDDDDSGPQVFLLSGWGAPGTGSSGPESTRRSWTCWCAMHRTNLTSDTLSPASDLIIMEFELERDIVNPLYPPVQAVGGSSSSIPHPTRISTSGSLNLGLNRQVPTQGFDSPQSIERGLDGAEGWLPNSEDIIESTTSYSKPIPALERIRKVTKSSPFSKLTGSTVYQRSQRRRPLPASGTEHLSFGMMDMFAVLSQINEQLGAVDSLEAFLKVVVGVIQDLTEFHRVMVYQFDETWNGEVVAELVDWTKTNDLYRGLHFPASDIPAQVNLCEASSLVSDG